MTQLQDHYIIVTHLWNIFQPAIVTTSNIPGLRRKCSGTVCNCLCKAQSKDALLCVQIYSLVTVLHGLPEPDSIRTLGTPNGTEQCSLKRA